MKNLTAAFLTCGLLLTGAASAPAFAQGTSSTTANAPAKKPVAKKAPAKRTERKSRRRATRKTDPLLPVASAIPAGAEKWSCGEGESMFIAGNMKRDQILTMYWKGRDYKLPRETTTTGADRFYDPASGMDLVVIPTKGMLFMDKGDQTRLADDCMTVEMREHGAPAPTQSNELIRK
ncbi:hypothetical protein [Robbsia sp. KACC 23696]|uniref:hypothetical protein n=1 Tax=Robbsia sp. KACC 23696 TaxID=3149231 RepID=UPI00325B659F